MNDVATALVKVWDPFVRIGHWTLVATFAIAYFLGDDILRLHVWSGYVLGIVVALRVVWGFAGPQRARFIDFVYRPWTVVTYALALIGLRGRRYIGHSPAGGAAIVVMLVMLGAVVYTGLMVYALEKNRGPLAAWVMTAPAATPADPATASSAATSVAQVDQPAATAKTDRKNEAPEVRARRRFWEWLHKRISDATLLLIVVHIGGVAWASYAHRENLVRAMITGKKRPEAKR